MTKAQAEREFCSEQIPWIRRNVEADFAGSPDWPWRRQAWNDWTDALQKDGRITAKQYDSWGPPRCVQKRGGR